MTATSSPPAEPTIGATGSWAADLRVGARLALSPGRSNRLRLLMAALGVGLCVLVLLIIAAIFPSLQAREQRLDRVSPTRSFDTATFQAVPTELVWQGRQITGLALAKVRADAPNPPGASLFPGVGDVLVSPALATALDHDPGLKPLVPGTIVGTIAPAALPTPDDLVFYLGQSASTQSTEWSASGWGATTYQSSVDDELTPTLSLLLAFGSVIVVAPMLLFVMLALRIGGPARDRRAATLRLVGASRAQIRRYAMIESLAASVLGFGLAVGAFFLLRWLLPGALDADLISADVRISALGAVLIVLVVPCIAAVTAAFSQRRAVIEPLMVVRRAPRRPRVWWRVAYCLGAVTTAVIVQLRPGPPQALTAPVAGLLFLALPVVMPLLISMVVRVRAHRATTRLTLSRLSQDPVTAGRTAAGLSIVVAGAVVMATLLSNSIGFNRINDSVDPYQQTGISEIQSPADFSKLPAALRAVPGVDTVLAYADFALTADPNQPQYFNYVVRIADCDTIRQLVIVSGCHDGDAFAVDDPSSPPAGSFDVQQYDTGAMFKWTPPPTNPARFAAPPATRTIPMDPGYLLTPGAVKNLPMVGSTLSLTAHISPSSVEAAEQTAGRTAGFAGLEALDRPPAIDATSSDEQLRVVRAGLILAGLLALLVCALGQIVVTGEQLAERRRSLALARAQGIPKRILARTTVWASTLPIILGVVLAALTGLWVSNLYIGHYRPLPSITSWATPTFAAAAMIFALLVAMSTAIRLKSAIQPEDIRTE